VAQVGFALLHGAQRYGWRAIGVFVAAGLVISNLLETSASRPASRSAVRRNSPWLTTIAPPSSARSP